MINFNKIFKRDAGVKIPDGPRAHYLCSASNRDIEWLDWINRQVIGWKPKNPPMPGDYLFSPMESGRTFIFRFIRVRPSNNQSFVGDLIDVGYDVGDNKAEAKDGSIIDIEPDTRFGAHYEYGEMVA